MRCARGRLIGPRHVSAHLITASRPSHPRAQEFFEEMYFYLKTMPLDNLWQGENWQAAMAKGQVGLKSFFTPLPVSLTRRPPPHPSVLTGQPEPARPLRPDPTPRPHLLRDRLHAPPPPAADVLGHRTASAAAAEAAAAPGVGARVPLAVRSRRGGGCTRAQQARLGGRGQRGHLAVPARGRQLGRRLPRPSSEAVAAARSEVRRVCAARCNAPGCFVSHCLSRAAAFPAPSPFGGEDS